VYEDHSLRLRAQCRTLANSAAWFNALSDPKEALAISAGTQPGNQVHREVITAMKEVSIDLSSARPQLLTEELARGAEVLVTMGCGEACPSFQESNGRTGLSPIPRDDCWKQFGGFAMRFTSESQAMVAERGWRRK
jgi:protein-tyrosine-phosphatase